MGIGYDYSLLRPRGTPTSNDAIASGVVSFMDVFDVQTETVMAGSRRGANMGVLNIYHPDIYDYVEAKSKDETKLRHFNMSIMVDDDFMMAVENKEKIHLHYPVYDDKYHIIKDSSKWDISKEVDAEALWNLIMKSAYMTGEPGILYYDTMNRDNNTWYTETITHTNPCVTGDTEILTDSGFIRIDSVVGENVNIWNGYEWSAVIPKITGENQEILKVSFSNGATLKCTPYHKFILQDDSRVECKDLKIGDTLKEFALPENNAVMSLSIVNIEKDEMAEKVYCFNEPLNHSGVFNGIMTAQCGEFLGGTVFGQEMPPENYGGACNLGSLFLHNFVKNPFTNKAELDFYKLGKTIKVAVRFLDNIIDINKYPLKHYENYQKNLRTIGLGVTGLADCLCMLGYKYNSEDALSFTDDLMAFITYTAYMVSIDLAIEKGSFPFLDKEKFIQSNFLQKHILLDQNPWGELVERIKEHGIRNARLISIAPVGTNSLTFGNNCSSGIEPIFSLSYDRKIKMGGQSEEDIQIVKMEDYAYGLYQEMKANGKKVDFDEDIFVTALDLTVDEHINMLSTIAYHIDMGVSKTVNVPTEYSFEDAKKIYRKCWENGIKGCTIFRPNEVRQGILVDSNDKTTKESTLTTKTYQDGQSLERGIIISVDDDLISLKKTITNGCGKFYLHTDFYEPTGEPLETFIDIGSGGGCERNLQFISRLISIALRAGVPIEAIIDQAKSIRPCKAYTDRTKDRGDTSQGTSCPSAIGNALQALCDKMKSDYECDGEDEIPQIQPNQSKLKTTQRENNIVDKTNICPECGSKLVAQGGCKVCMGDNTHTGCGWSKCE